MDNLMVLEITNFIISGKLYLLKDIISKIKQLSNKELEYAISNDTHTTYLDVSFGSSCFEGEELSYSDGNLYFEPVDFLLPDISITSLYKEKLDISNISTTDRNMAIYKALPDCKHDSDYCSYINIWTEEDMNSIYNAIISKYKKLGYNFHINNSYFVKNNTRRFEIT